MSSIKIIENSDNSLKFLLKDLDLCFINALRRIIMSDIGGYAFDEIEIKKNTTIFHDEFLKHRIGLIPVSMGSQITFGCSCSNNSETDKYILSNEIVALDENIEYRIMDNIPIAVLSNGDELDFVAKTNKGIAGKDIKYSLINNINFVKMKRINVDNVVENIKEYMYKDLYYGRNYLLDRENIKYNETSIYCMMMTSTMLDPKTVLSIGLLTLRRKIVNMGDIIVNELEVDNKYDNYKNFQISGIDYVEASIFVNMLLKRDDVKIATYTKKHLLDEFFEFKIEFEDYAKDIFEIKGVEMEKVLKIVDKMIKEVK